MGSFGLIGVLGFFGIFGKLVFVLKIVLLLDENLVDEGENMIFNCMVSGNFMLRIEWRFESEIFLLGVKYFIEEGILIVY